MSNYDHLIGEAKQARENAHAPFSNFRVGAALRAADEYVGNQSRVERSSTDANIPLSTGIDAISIGAGGSGGGAHSLQEWYDPTGREMGLKRALLTLLGISGIANEKPR